MYGVSVCVNVSAYERLSDQKYSFVINMINNKQSHRETNTEMNVLCGCESVCMHVGIREPAGDSLSPGPLPVEINVRSAAI